MAKKSNGHMYIPLMSEEQAKEIIKKIKSKGAKK